MNQRPCALCRWLDSRTKPDGDAWCWRYYRWRPAAGTVADCEGVERADGQSPPGQIIFKGQH